MEKVKIILEAIAFAARRHDGQIRKDGQTPYVSHAYRVAVILDQVFGVNDPEVLAAAVLHDTIEDTTTDFDDIEELFGVKIASWVSTLSKDKRLPNEQREEEYYKALGCAPDQVKLIKLADIFDNTFDSVNAGSSEGTDKILKKIEKYITLFRPSINERIKPAFTIVEKLLAERKGR